LMDLSSIFDPLSTMTGHDGNWEYGNHVISFTVGILRS
jgi:hypothetical protein